MSIWFQSHYSPGCCFTLSWYPSLVGKLVLQRAADNWPSAVYTQKNKHTRARTVEKYDSQRETRLHNFYFLRLPPPPGGAGLTIYFDSGAIWDEEIFKRKLQREQTIKLCDKNNKRGATFMKRLRRSKKLLSSGCEFHESRGKRATGRIHVELVTKVPRACESQRKLRARELLLMSLECSNSWIHHVPKEKRLMTLHSALTPPQQPTQKNSNYILPPTTTSVAREHIFVPESLLVAVGDLRRACHNVCSHMSTAGRPTHPPTFFKREKIMSLFVFKSRSHALLGVFWACCASCVFDTSKGRSGTRVILIYCHKSWLN